MLNLSQENKSDLGKDVGEKQGEEREQKVLPAEKTTAAVSYSDAQMPNGSERSNPAGRGDFPPWGPFPLATAPGTAAGRVGRPNLLEVAAAAQMLLGAGLRGETSKI